MFKWPADYKAKLRTQQYIKLKTGAKAIQQLNPGGQVKAQMAIWAIWSEPLTMSNDLQNIGDLLELTLYAIMDSSFLFDTINLGWSIVYNE